ncbi:hypothetical protein GA0115236_116818 [Streptomyces sp. IgraMP-1]|nr:hypothetical protein GA0115236_116818 [Streptomyces sp. IgraMP-1]
MPKRGPSVRSWGTPGHAAQDAGAVQDDEDVGVRVEVAQRVVVVAGGLAAVQLAEEFVDPAGDRLGVEGDQRHAVLPLGGDGVRQPVQPGPVGAGRGVRGEADDGEVAGAVQGGGLDGEPAGGRQGAGPVARDADDAEVLERQGDGDVGEFGLVGPVLLAPHAAPAEGEFHVGVEGAGADPQQHRVRVGEAALPEAAAGPGGEEQDLGGVGHLGAAFALLLLAGGGEQFLVGGEVLAVLLHRRAVLLLAVAVVADPLAGHHQRAHQAEQQHEDLLGDEPHGDAEEHRHERHDELELGPFRLGGRLGDDQPGAAPQRVEAGRPVVGEPALAHPGEVGVRGDGPVEDEKGVAHPDGVPERPGGLPVGLLAVDQHGELGVGRRDEDRFALDVDPDAQRGGGKGRVGDLHGAVGAGADVGGARAEPDDPSGGGPAGHSYLVPADRFAPAQQRADVVVGGDAHAVAEDGGGGGGRVAELAVGPEGEVVSAAGRGGAQGGDDATGPLLEGFGAGQRQGDVGGGGRLLRVDHDVVGLGALPDYGHQHTHGRVPPRQPTGPSRLTERSGAVPARTRARPLRPAPGCAGGPHPAGSSLTGTSPAPIREAKARTPPSCSGPKRKSRVVK